MELKLQTKKFGEILYKIDEEDLHLIENHKIYASKPSKNKIYLLRDDKKWLHKLIMPNCPKGYVVDHINRNTLDNRRCNLRYVTRSLNSFNMDVAASEDNTKVDHCFFNENENALLFHWLNCRCFCNPPFSKKAEFIKKAHEEVQTDHCPICVMILPLNSMDTKVWHEVIEGRYHYEILKGRIAFIDPDTKKPKKGNNSGTVIVYFKKRIEV